jgi:hypothetical protein
MQAKKLSPSKNNRRVNKSIAYFSMPKMEKIEFTEESMFITLNGGRILSVPLSKFPFIKKLSRDQRSKYHIAGGISLDFEDSDEVYHINELLGI